MDIKETKRKNLLIRLMERLKLGANFSKEQKTGNIKLKKKIVLIAMTGILGANALFTGCDSDDIILTDKDGNLLDKNGNIITLEQQEIDLLSAILENTEYQQAVNEYNAGNDSLMRAYSHPLTFLESKGYDVEAIKRGELEIETFSYIKESEPNSLYVRTNIVVDDVPEESRLYPYNAQCLLRFSITDNEKIAIEKFYNDKNFQANMLVGVLSDLKTPTVIFDMATIQLDEASYIEKLQMIANDINCVGDVDTIQFCSSSVKDDILDILVFSKDGGWIGTYKKTECPQLRIEEREGVNLLISGGYRSFKESEILSFENSIERATYYIPDLGVNNVKDLGN